MSRSSTETAAWREGYEAASKRHTFRDHCPYNFASSGCKEKGDQNLFEREFRPKMNDWFVGWKAWLDERGLGFNFQSQKKRPK